MSEFPAMPMYWANFFADTASLTGEEAAYYAVLLGHAWLRQGALPADDAVLARLARVTPRKWTALKGPIMALWRTDDAGELTQKRLRQTYDDVSRKVQANRLNGAKGGRPSSSGKKVNDINKTANPTVHGGLNAAKMQPLRNLGDVPPPSCTTVLQNTATTLPEKPNEINETAKPNGSFSFAKLESDKKESSSSSESRTPNRGARDPPDDDDDDEFKLIEKVRQALVNTAPHVVVEGLPVIHALLDDGCDLDADMLPALCEIEAKAKEKRLIKFSAPFVADNIRARRDARLASPKLNGHAPPKAKLVHVKIDTPQWAAWKAHRGGKSFPIDNSFGYWAPSEWPPGYEPPRPDSTKSDEHAA